MFVLVLQEEGRKEQQGKLHSHTFQRGEGGGEEASEVDSKWQ